MGRTLQAMLCTAVGKPGSARGRFRTDMGSLPRDFKSLASTSFATRARRESDGEKRAGNRTRTGDPNLGKVVLYQLSYSRDVVKLTEWDALRQQHPVFPS